MAQSAHGTGVDLTRPIWTLEARDSVMLQVIQSHLGLSDDAVRAEIYDGLRIVVDTLQKKRVAYDDLRSALVPQQKRREIALLFDTARIESGMYGVAAAEHVVPHLPCQLKCAFKIGDLILENQDVAQTLLRNHVRFAREPELIDSSQLFCIYINNLSERMVTSLLQNVKAFEGFAGYFDATKSSPMKDWLAITLVTSYLKAGGTILNGHEDDVPDTEDFNMAAWPWEEHGYSVRSLRHMYYHLFLGYKVERRALPEETDSAFALIAISGKPLPLETLPVAVADAKAEYIRQNHAAGLKRAGLEAITDKSLADLIRAKIHQSYLYYLRYRAADDTSLFNIMLELENPENLETTRILAGLEYDPDAPALRLVTLY